MKGKFTKQEKSWIMYDWANSVYATIIMAAVFPIYFSTVMESQGLQGDVYWGYGTSIATLVVALLAPILGAVGSFEGWKKKMFSGMMILGIVTTLLMAISDNWKIMLVGYVLSYIGFAGANIYYDSFLNDITTEERMDKVSAYGFAMGYIGGSTIPFLISIALIMFGGKIGIGGDMAVKISVVMTSVWWGIFSLPILLNIKQTHSIGPPDKTFVKKTFGGIWNTMKEIAKDKRILMFLIAYFFYIDGVGTVIHMATSYGASLGLGQTGMILALLVTQIVAVPFSILFSKLSEKVGSINMIMAGIVIYIIICVMGFFMGFTLENAEIAAIGLHGDAYKNSDLYLNALNTSTILFWILAALVGTSQGGIQALSRSTFARIIPKKRSSEFFGFFDIFGKFASIIGPFLYAGISNITGRSSYGILSLIVLFTIGGIILFMARKNLKI